MKRISFIAAAALFIGLTAFSLSDGMHTKKCSAKHSKSEYMRDSSLGKTWYRGFNAAGISSPKSLYYNIHGRYTRPVTKQALAEANVLADFIDGYPANWIADYASVEINAISNGKQLRAVSLNDTLSAEQKRILSMADISVDIVINARLNYTTQPCNKVNSFAINISMTVIPETEAEYTGGLEAMMSYLKENIIAEITEKTPEQFQKGAVVFIVNEEGGIENARISQTSGDEKTDNLLIERIANMPKWKPAKNLKGEKVKQEFEFSMGSGGC